MGCAMSAGDTASCHLIKQWLEQVMVSLIDELHADILTDEFFCCAKTSKASSDDDNLG
jgi:hypothetical protein